MKSAFMKTETLQLIAKKIVVGMVMVAMLAVQSPLAFAEDTGDTGAASSPTSAPSSSDAGSSGSSSDSSSGNTSSDTSTSDSSNTDATDDSNENSPTSLAPILPLSDTGSSEVNANNTATTTNTVTSDAQTGDNHISDGISSATTTPNGYATSTDTTLLPGTGTTTIETGNALGSGDVTNVVNTNTLNSDVSIGVLNTHGSTTIDTRDIFQGGGASCSNCSYSTTTLPQDQTVNATNTASIDNTVIVRSGSGDNTASTTLYADIFTGNAYANADVVNVVNTNFIDSQYLLLILNNFGNLNGDIVLPSAEFFTQFLNALTNNQSTAPMLPSQFSSNAQNTANIKNDLDTNALTGNNTLSTNTESGTGLIQTGNAYTGTTMLNQVNQNYIGGSEVNLIFRVFGTWTGNIYNLPQGLTWNGTPVGIQFVGENGQTLFSNQSTLAVNTQNTATINNTVDVEAVTGNNHATGTNALIDTGNAYANANIVNIVNANVIGKNWMQAIVNIFGDWNGNLSFGQPDLWVGTDATYIHNPYPGAEIDFRYTIRNNGDAPVNDIVLKHNVHSSKITFTSGTEWNVGSLQPGEMKEVIKRAKISDDFPYGNTPIDNTVSVRGTEPDNDTSDNTDEITVIITRHYPPGYHDSNNVPGTPNFTITKTSSVATTTAGSTVDYIIKIVNNGAYVEHAILVDTIASELGVIVHKEEWDLGAVYAGEEITITYTASFNTLTKAGMYKNSAYIKSGNGAFIPSDSAIKTVQIIGNPSVPLVLGAYTAKTFRPMAYKDSPGLPDTGVLEINATSSATTTDSATTTAVLSGFTDQGENNMNLLAGAFAALGLIKWYWYLLLLLLLALYIYHRVRQETYHQ
jgi:hypothetical protein